MKHRMRAQTAIRDVISSCRRVLVWQLLFSFCTNLLMLAAPLYMMQVFDRVLSSGSIETLVFLTIIAVIAVSVMALIETARGQFMIRVGNWLDRRLSQKIIKSILHLHLANRGGSAQPLRDLATVRNTLSSSSLNAIIDIPWVPGFILIIWLMNPLLGAVALGSAIGLFTVGLLNESFSRKSLHQAGELSIFANQSIEAALRNAEAVQAMGMLPALLARHGALNGKVLTSQQKAGDLSAAFIGLSKSLRILVQILILGSGAWLVLQGKLTSGGMIAASILLGRALAPVEQSIGAWKNFIGTRDAWSRLTRLLTEVPEGDQGTALPEPMGRVICDQISLWAPGGEHPILNAVSFDLAAGEVLGIIGPSAAGKSTLCRVLTGTQQPTRGHARLDGADVFAWPSDDLGPYVGYLPQDVELFAGTITENISRLSLNPDSSAVIEAAQTAGVHEMILTFPKGYDTDLGDSGSFLSGGQRQRIGLARALYGRPKLIVLDEPNAGLDAIGEQALVDAIGKAKEWGSTVILVSHQPNIVRSADKIMFMRDGKNEAFGPRDEIFRKLRPARIPAAAGAAS